MKGILFVVATPLGNLGDWSPRAREAVAAADLVLVEDTRISHKLFESFGLNPRVRVFEKHRERRETGAIVAELLAGKSIVLLSDAGTPAIADPGAVLVDKALETGIQVVAVPGPSILSAALSVAGEATLPITFHGYPPEKTSERQALWQELLGAAGAHVVLLPPHDAPKILTELSALLPARTLVLGRELTKLHEQVIRGTATEILQTLQAAEALRGEMVLVIRAPAKPAAAEAELAELAAEAERLQSAYGLTGKDLSDFLAFKTGTPRRTAYRAVLSLSRKT